MKFSRKNLLVSLVFFVMFACFLFFSKKTAEFAYIGLKTWFDQMIISLFPYMVLINLLIRSGLSKPFIKPLHHLLCPIFQNTESAVFVVFFGFLSGFPLGAKCAVDLYKKGDLSKTNTEYLLCFCNNLGPAYMLGFFLSVLKPDCTLSEALFCFYGIPMLYGILLRYTLYKNALSAEYLKSKRSNPSISKASVTISGPLFLLPDAIQSALTQLASLGGYMILFNALRIIPHILFSNFPGLYIAVQSLLEVSGGLLCISNAAFPEPLRTGLLFALFSFNGLCCHFQTFALLKDTPFSAQKYMLHKIVLCSITVCSLFALRYIR